MGKLNIGVILPHVKLYGGVKRFLELGNILVLKGHKFTIFSPTGDAPSWFNFLGQSKTLEGLKSDELDALFFTEPKYAEISQNVKTKKRIFYHVREGENLKAILKYGNIDIYACSTNIYENDVKKYKLTPFKAIGAIDTSKYYKKDFKQQTSNVFTILAYGRLAEGRKGTKYVVKACERVYKKHKNIRLILFDAPVDENMKRLDEKFTTNVPYEFILDHPFEKNTELFHRADVFISAEKKAGWANTVAEAMACGIPVIATQSGSKDLLVDNETGLKCTRNSFNIARRLKYLMNNTQLLAKFNTNGRNQIEKFSWEQLAEKIINHLEQELG